MFYIIMKDERLVGIFPDERGYVVGLNCTKIVKCEDWTEVTDWAFYEMEQNNPLFA